MEAQAERRRARAQLRLLHDLRVLREEPLEAAEPLDDSCFTWHANLELDGELLHFEIIVPSTYPSEAPSVFFPTGLPHPNCFPQRAPDGRASYFVCLDMLGNTGTTDEVGSGWSSAYDLRGLLAQLQAFVLDSRNQYHRAGGLTKHNALAAARRYCCPHCPHRPKRPYPLPRPAERRQRLTLLKSLAPPRTDRRQQQEDRRSAEAAPPPPICRVTVEPRPWRDVQRLATHVCCMAAPQAAQAACPSAMKGWQEPGKGRVLRSKHAAQMSADMQRHVAAVQIQAMVRMCLARALAMCLRRLQVPGAMPSSLKAAQAESVRLGESATALSLRLSQAQAAEVTVRAEEKARGTLQERALMAAFESLARKRRNLQKRLRQISELASMSAPLSEEQQAKVARRKDTEHELQKMDRRVGVPPCALTSAELSAEARRDAETAGFHELFSEALQAEREVSVKLKSKLRKERRFAKLAAEPMVSRASQWALHMDLARSAFVEIRAMGRLADVYRELGKVFCEWRAAAVGVRMRSAGKQKANRRRPECLGSKDGVCHWAKVSYTLQIGVILPMMTYKELLLLATVSRGLRASAEDGCLWSVQMSRYYPLSALTPASMKDWKYAFQCELNQAIASLECFHTKQHALDDNAVIGIPIEFTINPKTEKTDYIYSSMDFLSHEAFAFDSVRKTVYKEDFTHWLPLYFSEVHWARSLPLLPRALVQLLPHRRGGFQPDMAIEVFSKMINTLVVLICDKGIAFSDRAAKAYCLLHRWALRCMQEWPELRRYVDGRIDSFCRGQQHRSKEQEPNLGEFMALLLLSSRPWARVAPHVLEEMMDREVLWLCTEHPCLANVAGATAPSDEQRLELSWKAKLVGKRLYAFHVSCFTMFKDARGADEVALDYDRFYGQPSQSLLNQFRRNTQTILDMSDWGTFFQLVRVKAPAPQRLAEMLRQSVKNSRKRGYHRDGMDFNRVHASGTSKILRKGESYLAAATLSAVDVEEHWSWAAGEVKYLDATCLLYDSKHTYAGHLDYNNKTLWEVSGQAIKDGALVHSGDQLDHEKQSGFHQIHVQLDALPATVQYLYITVSAWQDARLRDIRQPSVRMLDPTRQELCRYDVEAAEGGKTAILMCVLHRRPERSTSQVSRWALEAIGDVGDGAADRYGPIRSMIEAFRQRKGW